jgi:DNA-binding FrmR family transcriptional regulator
MSATTDTKHHYHYQQHTDALLMRLRRMEGQVRGVQKMTEEGRYCVDIVTQLQAISAANRVSEQVLERHIRGCVSDAIREQRGDEAIRS